MSAFVRYAISVLLALLGLPVPVLAALDEMADLHTLPQQTARAALLLYRLSKRVD